MGVVYLARNRLLGRLEAVKVLIRPWSQERFRREIQAAARLSHPNIVTAYSARVTGGVLSFAMEFVEGNDLAKVVRTRGPLPASVACDYALQAARGLQHAFVHGMTHRDIKPHNLILSESAGRGAIKILDFGLAKLADSEVGPTGLTSADQPIGTPGYAAPEQIANASSADTRSDIYGLGATLTFLLTGYHPRAARDSANRPDETDVLPPGLVPIIDRMTAPDPADRFQSPQEVVDALQAFAVHRHNDSEHAAASANSPQPSGLTWPNPENQGAIGDSVGRKKIEAPTHRWLLMILNICAAVLCLFLVVGIFAGSLARTPLVTREDDIGTGTGSSNFVPIFNGTDLTGWIVDGGEPGEWRIEEGVIATTGIKGKAQSWLLTQRDYEDVRVRFEYQLGKGGNTGFAFRAVPGERPILLKGIPPTPTPYHQQLEISDDSDPLWAKIPTGQVNGWPGHTGPSLKPVRRPPVRPAGEWNAAEIELRGQSLSLDINGARVQSADLEKLVELGSQYPALYRRRGRIGFQQYAKTVRFRNIEIMELATAAPQKSPG